MERLTRSNPRRSRFSSSTRATARALLPFLASLHRLYTTSVDEVCLTRGSVYRVYYRSLPALSSRHPRFTSSTVPVVSSSY